MILRSLAAVLIGGIAVLAAKDLDRTDLEVPRSAQALKIATGGIYIDGVVDEDEWDRARFVSNFVQRDPLEGEDPTELTEFAILYDDEFIYVAVRANDSDPSGIRSILSRRDEQTPSDWVFVAFDSYGDNRTAFEFWLNPLGVKRDVRRYDDDQMDPDWDSIWEGKTTVHNTGWSAEYRIPFRELRFSDAHSQSWGLQVYRHISRKNEDNYWTFWGKEEAGHVRHYGQLTNLVDIPRQRRVYVSPYSTGQYAVSADYVNAVHSKNYEVRPNLGADVKVGLTNNLTLDVTFNPDFGQVEADPAVLNLTDFETFYAEKRPFFVEGSNIFNFTVGFGGDGQGESNLFYPRRIGRRPQFSPDTEGYTEEPTATTILGAAKLSGKTSHGTSIGVLSALTAEEQAIIRFTDQPTEKEVVEPLTNYFVTRVQQDLREGKTTIGGILTSTNRRLDESYLKSLRRDSYAAGLDFSHLFHDDTYQVGGALSGTSVRGAREAITDTQESSVHYFQRPDAASLEVDTTLTELSGYAYKVSFDKVRGEHWRGNIRHQKFSPGFEANDIGYNGFVGRYSNGAFIQYREDSPGNYVRQWNVNLNLFYNHTVEGVHDIMGRGGNINTSITFLNYWTVGGGMFHNPTALHQTALWGGPALATDRSWGGFAFMSSDPRKVFSINLSAFTFGQKEADIRYVGFNPGFTWRPTDYFSLTASSQIRIIHDTWMPWIDYESSEDQQTGDERFIVATLDQTTVGTTLRFDLTLTPDLTIQFYGSPYLDAGIFSEDKLVVAPKAGAFTERYHTFTAEERDWDGNPNTYDYDVDGGHDGVINFEVPEDRDFNYKQFNANLVLRWEYQTGSAVYLVWSNNLSHSVDVGDFDFARDMKQLLKSSGENVFMIKASYLLNI